MTYKWMALVGLLALGGCASTSTTQDTALLAMPQQPSPQMEVAIAKLSELVLVADLTDEQRAKVLYDRGIRYDAAGLRTLARIDFTRALQLKPDYADVYNFMGIYYTQAQEYDRAYEAFGAVLELAPEYSYAYLNRGIAQLYGSRETLAAQDLETFYLADESDPYRVIWLYLAERELDPASALARLQFNRSKLPAGNWANQLVDIYLQQGGDDDLVQAVMASTDDHREQAERLCETYFYLGKRALAEGDRPLALRYFRQTLATNIYEYVEHRYALLELELLSQSEEDQGLTAGQVKHGG